MLLLIIGESTQQALLGNDFSVTNALLVITSLILLDILLSLVKAKLPRLGAMLDGLPMVIVENGAPIEARMKRARVSLYDVMQAARSSQGLERMDQIRYAVLEIGGSISIVPKE